MGVSRPRGASCVHWGKRHLRDRAGLILGVEESAPSQPRVPSCPRGDLVGGQATPRPPWPQGCGPTARILGCIFVLLSAAGLWRRERRDHTAHTAHTVRSAFIDCQAEALRAPTSLGGLTGASMAPQGCCVHGVPGPSAPLGAASAERPETPQHSAGPQHGRSWMHHWAGPWAPAGSPW